MFITLGSERYDPMIKLNHNIYICELFVVVYEVRCYVFKKTAFIVYKKVFLVRI